jgi:hypothetical protein
MPDVLGHGGLGAGQVRHDRLRRCLLAAHGTAIVADDVAQRLVHLVQLHLRVQAALVQPERVGADHHRC